MALSELSKNVRMGIGAMLFIAFMIFTFILKSNTPQIFYAIVGGFLGFASIYVLSFDVEVIKNNLSKFLSVILVGVGISIWESADNPLSYIFSIGAFIAAGYIFFRGIKGFE